MPQIIAPDEAGDSPGDYPAEMSSYWASNGLLAQLIHSRGAVGLEIRCLLCQRFDGAVLMPPIVYSKPRPLAPHYLSQQLAPNVDPKNHCFFAAVACLYTIINCSWKRYKLKVLRKLKRRKFEHGLIRFQVCLCLGCYFIVFPVILFFERQVPSTYKAAVTADASSC